MDGFVRDPVASLISVRWSWRHFYFAKFRLCNARQYQIGWLTVIIRAKRLWTHDELFEPHSQEFMTWLDHAYRDGSKGNKPRFTKWNMEVAYRAGMRAASDHLRSTANEEERG